MLFNCHSQHISSRWTTLKDLECKHVYRRAQLQCEATPLRQLVLTERLTHVLAGQYDYQKKGYVPPPLSGATTCVKQPVGNTPANCPVSAGVPLTDEGKPGSTVCVTQYSTGKVKPVTQNAHDGAHQAQLHQLSKLWQRAQEYWQPLCQACEDMSLMRYRSYA